MPEKPIGVMPLSIVAIAFGAMGFFGGAFGLVGLILNPKQDPPGATNARLAELNVEFAKKNEAIVRESRPIQLVLVPAMMVSSMVLIGAGIAGVKMRARPFVQTAFAASLIIDTAGAAYGTIVQFRIMDVLQWYLGEMAKMEKMPPGVEMGMKFGVYTGIFFGVGWIVAKTVFYVLGIVYFGKKNVRDAFAAAA